MARHRNRDSRTYEEEDKQDIRRQEGIFLCTLFLMVLLLVSLYFQLSVLAIAIVTAALYILDYRFLYPFQRFLFHARPGTTYGKRPHIYVRQPYTDPHLCLVLRTG